MNRNNKRGNIVEKGKGRRNEKGEERGKETKQNKINTRTWMEKLEVKEIAGIVARP